MVGVRGKFLSTLKELMNNALSLVERWCLENHLGVNPSKAEAMLFTSKRKIGDITPTLAGTPIQVSRSVKYLGVIFDPKLTWIRHVEYKSKSAICALWQCRNAICSSWGLRPKIVKWIYTGIIRPFLDYACVAWSKAASTSAGVKALTKVNRLACLLITGAMKSTSTLSLEMLTGILPLSLHIKKLALRACARLSCSGLEAKLLGGQLMSELSKASPLSNQPTDVVISSNQLNPKFCTKIITECNPQSLLPLNGRLVIYISAATSDCGSGGCAIICDNEDTHSIEISLDKHATYQQAELASILSTQEYTQIMGKHEVIFVTSSNQVFSSITAPKTRSRLILECRSYFDKLSSVTSLWLYHLPSNCPNSSMLEAYAKAQISLLTIPMGPLPSIPLDIKHIYNEIDTFIVDEVNKSWSADTSNKTSKIFITSFDKSIHKFVAELPKKDLSMLVAVSTGHCRLNAHMFKLKLISSPLCQLCRGEAETVEHFLAICPSYVEARRDVLGRNLLDISDIKSITLDQLLRFIIASGRFKN